MHLPGSMSGLPQRRGRRRAEERVSRTFHALEVCDEIGGEVGNQALHHRLLLGMAR